jgi:hypothetical protein
MFELIPDLDQNQIRDFFLWHYEHYFLPQFASQRDLRMLKTLRRAATYCSSRKIGKSLREVKLARELKKVN